MGLILHGKLQPLFLDNCTQLLLIQLSVCCIFLLIFNFSKFVIINVFLECVGKFIFITVCYHSSRKFLSHRHCHCIFSSDEVS